MNIVDQMELAKKYSTCPNCGNEIVGNGEGTFIIEENYFKRSCKCGWSVEVSKRIKIVAKASIGKLQIFECVEFDENGGRNTKYINVAELKERGIIKTTNQMKKAEEYLNTKEGMELYKSLEHTAIS